jgi:GR25 family glycosyltransferase involved in LPS biosynthesis
MLFSENVTFVIPIFRLESHQKLNLKFILPYILKTGCKVFIVEQSKDTLSDLSDVVPIHKNIKHLLYVSNSDIFHKTGIINWATNNHVDTKYVWVNDTDFYMKYADALEADWNADFIKPYTCGKKLSLHDTNTILSGKKLDVSYEDESAQYISLYGALSFIFEKDAFLNIGGMDETIFGWGKEDIEFSDRVKRLNIDTQELDFNGIHLWHPTDNKVGAREPVASGNIFKIHEYFDEVYCVNLDRRPDRWIAVNSKLKKVGIGAIRFGAIDGQFLTDEDVQIVEKNKDNKEPNAIISTGEMGCLLSHLEVIKDAKANNYKRILIFEDDVYVSNDFEKRITDAQNIQWKLLYLGASQCNWNGIGVSDNFYKSKNTFGTFAYAVDMSLYDELIEQFGNKKKQVDRILSDVQEKYYNSCYTFYPNIAIADVEDSDIRDTIDIDINKHAITMRWNLENFELGKQRKKKILLMPDIRGWAFDNIVKAIVKYNPYPDNIHYEIIYARDLYQDKCILEPSDWDLIYIMFEAETIIPCGNNIIRGCYAAYWLENENYPPNILGNYFAKCKGAVFANGGLKDQLVPHLPSDFPMEIIHDAADETVFYPIDDKKNVEFTVLFVGNTKRKIKNFSNIVWVCKEAGVTLKVCERVDHKELVHEYATADLCINFSTFEGGPQTFVEAALCGVPMLIRDTNEISKIVPCFIGKTTEDFVEIINHLKNNRQECAKKGKEAYDVAIKRLTYRHAADKFAKFFLENIPKKNLETELTVFIIRSGNNPNYEDCLQSIKNQNCTFVFDEIVDVSPMSAAFQQMIERCDTPYYVQVDEDMVLDKCAIERLYYSIRCTKKNVCMVSYMLTDIHLDMNIFGIKIYRRSTMINYPYNLQIISCEKEQMIRLENDGYIVQMTETSLGKHSPKWTTELIYERYFDLMEKWKVYKYDWMGKLPKKLFDIVRINPSEENIFALIGAISSISKKECIRNREKNFLVKEEAYENIKEMLSKKD